MDDNNRIYGSTWQISAESWKKIPPNRHICSTEIGVGYRMAEEEKQTA